MCELVDSGEENEPQIRVEALDRTVEIPHYLPECRQLGLVVHHIQQRRVIFVNDDDGFLAGLLESGFYQEFQSRVYIDVIHIWKLSINGLIFFQFISEDAYQLLLIQMFSRGHIEMKNRMFTPFFFHFAGLEPFEKFLSTFEIAMESRRQQRLAEPARPAQENVFVLIRNVIDIARLVNIYILAGYNFRKCLYPNRESPNRCLHSPKLYTFPKIIILYDVHHKTIIK